MPLMAVVFGDFTNTFGGLQPGALGIDPISTVDAFNSRNSKSSLNFVYIGIGVTVSTFFATLSWTVSGERISRRLRRYAHAENDLIEVYISRRCSVRILQSSIGLEPGRSRIGSLMM